MREFSLVFGTSELAVATVLAAYMFGLAIGAIIAGRILYRIDRPVAVYGILEAGVAISALAVPWLLSGASALYGLLLGNQPAPPNSIGLGQAAFYLLSAFAILAIPTGFMGATLPLLTRHLVTTDRQVGPRVGLLYGINTAGAVAGTVFAGFILLPRLGLRQTVYVGIAINLLVFVIAAMLARGSKLMPTGTETAEADTQRRAHWILPIMLVSGATSFVYEVLWTRLLNHVLGGSIYAFATMLAAFLTGIALGGGLAGLAVRDRRQAVRLFAVVQIAIGVLSLLIFENLENLVPVNRGLTVGALFSGAVLLPGALFIGATFPLAVRILTEDHHRAGENAAQVYGWNTIGAIAGAISAGFFLIPLLGFVGSIKTAVLVNLALAAVVLTTRPEDRMRFAVPAAAFLVIATVFYQPSRPLAVIHNSLWGQQIAKDDVELFYEVGRSTTVLVTDGIFGMTLFTNGLPEAVIRPPGAVESSLSDAWLTSLPTLARPDGKDLLMIGLGGGSSLETIAASIAGIDVIELEPEVVSANRHIADLRRRDPLADPRVSIVTNDARNALRLTRKRYDIIASQPSHPWTVGASHLFTIEFLTLVKRNLRDGGVYASWMNSAYIDTSLLVSLAATLAAKFEYVELYRAPNTNVAFADLIFLASDRPLTLNPEPNSELRQLGMGTHEDLLSALLLDEVGLRLFASGAPLITDDHNLMAMRSRYRGDGLRTDQISALITPFDPLVNINSALRADARARGLDLAYIAYRLTKHGTVNRARRLMQSESQPAQRRLIAAMIAYAREEDETSQRLAAETLRLMPNNATAAFLAGKFEGAAGVLNEALAHRDNGAWEALADLETELAKAGATDPWYPAMTELRAHWRAETGRNTDEVLPLLDAAFAIAPSKGAVLTRIEITAAAYDRNALIESAASFATMVASFRRAMEQGKIGATAADYDSLALELERVQALVQAYDSWPNPARAERVIRRLQSLALDGQ